MTIDQEIKNLREELARLEAKKQQIEAYQDSIAKLTDEVVLLEGIKKRVYSSTGCQLKLLYNDMGGDRCESTFNGIGVQSLCDYLLGEKRSYLESLHKRLKEFTESE